MTTIGDSFSIIALLLGIGFTTWAIMILSSLLFQERSRQAKNLYETRPFIGFILGLVFLLTEGTISIIIVNLPNPVMKFIGFIGLAIPVAISAVGSSGLCKLVSERIRSLDANISEFAALNRAALLIAVAWFFPLLGWFILAPLLFIVSLGIGLKTMFKQPNLIAEVIQ